MAGQKLGSYRLWDLLGAGGMAEVYRAHDTKLDRKAVAALSHPNILAIHDFGSEHGVNLRGDGAARR